MLTELRRRVATPEFLAGLTVTTVAALAYAWFLAPLWSGGVPHLRNGDDLGMTAVLQSASQSPIFGRDPHVADGTFTQWSGSQIGWLMVLLARALSPLGLDPAELVVVISVANAMLVAGTSFVVARRFSRSWIPAAVLALAIALSPYCIGRAVGHLNVMACYLPIAAFGAVATGPLRRRTIAATVLLGLLASAWWQIGTGFLAAAALAIAVIAQHRPVAVRALATGLALVPGIALTGVLYATHGVDAALASRSGPWDSNLFGGHLLDVFGNAPVLNHVMGIDPTVLAPGLSAYRPGVGTVFLAFVLVTAGFSLQRTFRPTPVSEPSMCDRAALHIATLAVIITFVGGGLGNVQAGLAVLLHAESPAREWSRFVIVLAFAVGAYALSAIDSVPRSVSIALVATLLVIVAVDFVLASTQYANSTEEDRDFGITPAQAERFADSGCTVVQIPIGTFDVPRPDWTPAFYYEDLRPYLTYPKVKWSAGGPLLKDGRPMLLGLARELERRPSSRFCGYLVDHEYAAYLDGKGLLSPSETRLVASAGTPHGRYSFTAIGEHSHTRQP